MVTFSDTARSAFPHGEPSILREHDGSLKRKRAQASSLCDRRCVKQRKKIAQNVAAFARTRVKRHDAGASPAFLRTRLPVTAGTSSVRLELVDDLGDALPI